MYCPNCGAEIKEENARFCGVCGHRLPDMGQGESAATKFDEKTPNSGRRDSPIFNGRNRTRSKKGIIVGGVIAAVVIVAGGVFTVMAKPFASGKQLLLNSIGSTAFTSGDQMPIQENLTLNLKNIHMATTSGVAAGLLSTLNGSNIHIGILFDAKDKKANVSFSSDYQSVKHSGQLWVDNTRAVLSASDYQSLLTPLLPQGLTLPKYLTTDSSQVQGLQKFWRSVDTQSNTLTKSQKQSVITMEKMLVNAIPGKYIKRSSLNSVTIRFDQSGLEDIIKSEVRAIYSHKSQVADAMNALSKVRSTPTQANVGQNVIQALNRFPEEAALAAITTAFNSGRIAVQENTITMTKGIFSQGFTETFDGGVSIHSPNTSMSIGYKVNSHEPAREKVQMPTTTSANSKTFSQLRPGNVSSSS